MKTTIISILLLGTINISHAQLITTYAGNGSQGFSGDGGPATAAQVDRPRDVTIDSKGNLFIADCFNYRIRKVDLNGTITTWAGTGINGHSGDGGPATSADIGLARSITIDTADNIYFADGGYVRKISPAGIITTIAGDGMGGYSGDGGPATAAGIIANGGIAVDRQGNVFFSDLANYVVRKINSAGIISTFAGNGSVTVGTDGIAATSSGIGQTQALAADTSGNIYLAAGQKVRKVNTTGIISTFAGSTFGYSGDGGPATAAQFQNPVAVIADKFGNVYISDQQNYVIRRVDKNGIIHAFAGNGAAGYSGDGGPATAAQVYTLTFGLAVIGNGAVFITDNQVNERIRAVNHPPYFTTGATYSITACNDTPYIALDTLLSVMDSNTAQPLLWSINTPPLHGTLTAADTLYADTIATLPAGTLYTPDGSYIGTDSFSVTIYDGIMRDTITVYLNMIDCILNIHNTTGNTGDFQIYPNPAMGGRFSCILPAATEQAKLVITDATGRIVKQIDIATGTQTDIQLHVPPGLYLAHLYTSMGIQTRKLTITQ